MHHFSAEHHDQMTIEHTAWRSVCNVLKAAGVGDINEGGKNEYLARAIMRWGEELSELRRLDPDISHGLNALHQAREAWPLLEERD